MIDYITKSIGSEYFVEPKTGADYLIKCASPAEAHKLSLSLMLGTTPSPIEAQELFSLLGEYEEKKIFIAKTIALENERESDFEEEINSCCQSGCKGCPTFTGW